MASHEIRKSTQENKAVKWQKGHSNPDFMFRAGPILPPSPWAAVMAPVIMNVNELLMRS